MPFSILNRLLSTLTVRVQSFVLREIKEGRQLAVEPTQFIAIYYVLRGFGAIAINGGLPVSFGPSCVVIVPAGLSQTLGGESFASLATDPASPFLDIATDHGVGNVLFACGSIDVTYAGSLCVFDSLREPIVENVSPNSTMRGIFETMLFELSRPDIGGHAIADSLMKSCIIFVLRQHVRRLGVHAPFPVALQDARLARAISSIVECPSASHTVDSLAALAGMSRSTFAQTFTLTCGWSPIEFVQRVRLRLAAHLLVATDLPIKVIAGNVGYASRSYFTRAFRSVYEIDPISYRTYGGSADDHAERFPAKDRPSRWPTFASAV